MVLDLYPLFFCEGAAEAVIIFPYKYCKKLIDLPSCSLSPCLKKHSTHSPSCININSPSIFLDNKKVRNFYCSRDAQLSLHTTMHVQPRMHKSAYVCISVTLLAYCSCELESNLGYRCETHFGSSLVLP